MLCPSLILSLVADPLYFHETGGLDRHQIPPAVGLQIILDKFGIGGRFVIGTHEIDSFTAIGPVPQHYLDRYLFVRDYFYG